MLKHVVMWKFKDEAEGNSKEFKEWMHDWTHLLLGFHRCTLPG